MDLGDGLGHLTYSTLVHPGDTWPEMRASLEAFLPRVKARVSPDAPFGVSLRLSASSAATLHGDPAERAWLRDFLAAEDLYLYTVNAFPYDAFKGGRVKERVYEPGWQTRERTEYTKQVADVLADVVRTPGIEPSIQTVPLAFRPAVTSADVVEAFTRNVLEVAAHLVGLHRRTGRVVTLAIEPEPSCFLETTDETIAYFRDHLHSGDAAREVARLARIPVSEAHVAVRRHLGVVFDVCHQALEHEDIPTSLRALVDAGVPILKLQEAAALDLPEVTQATVDALANYTETIYLTQTMELRDGRMTRYLNLQDALAAWARDPGPRAWRVHFHVPVFLDDLGPFGTTRGAIAQALALHREQPLSRHLEIETYTWDVLPEGLRTGDIVDDVVRELEWVRGELLGARAS